MGDDGRILGRKDKASMREVAQLAEVAMSSVSRVLSGHPDVSQEMRSRVLEAVRELNYEPDFLGQSLRRGATLSVGYVVSDISNPLHATIASGAESILRAAGYSMLLMNSEGDPELDAAHIRFFQRRRTDGLILSLASESYPGTLEALTSASEPVVLVDRQVPAELDAQVSNARNDHRSGVKSAVESLLALGHRRIALITGSTDIWPVRERIAGMEAAIGAHGLPNETQKFIGSLSAEYGEVATEQVLRTQPRPTAVIAGGNQVLEGCIRSLRKHAVRIPDEMSLVTCDDIALTELHSPPISSVTRDTAELGKVAATLLLSHLHGEGPTTVTLPTSYQERASCARVPAD